MLLNISVTYKHLFYHSVSRYTNLSYCFQISKLYVKTGGISTIAQSEKRYAVLLLNTQIFVVYIMCLNLNVLVEKKMFPKLIYTGLLFDDDIWLEIEGQLSDFRINTFLPEVEESDNRYYAVTSMFGYTGLCGLCKTWCSLLFSLLCFILINFYA